MIELKTPISFDQIKDLKIGDVVCITGEIITARDQAHLRIRKFLEEGKELPYNFNGSCVFHAGPVIEKKEGQNVLRVVGPTTSIRMEPYADMVGKLGVKAIIGKGGMDQETQKACKKYGYIYLQAAPGCAVKLASGIEKVNGVHWEELSMPEAMWVFKANKFGPLVVGMDAEGNSVYKNLRNSAEKLLNEEKEK